MNILLAGALSWNPERMIALAERGHRLFGVWSRTMPWEQGPYPFAKGFITDVNVDDAIELLHNGEIDIVYSLFQSYDRTLWDKSKGNDLPDIWTLLSTLQTERSKGVFDVPIVRHWGFDIHNVDLAVARQLDGQIFCNRQKFDYWMLPRSEGGCGLDFGTASQSVAFMDGDLPSASFMNNAYAPKLSKASGEIHTVCIGRPLGIDLAAAARNGIHVHVYGNGLDDIAMCFAHTQRVSDRRSIRRFLPFLHIHPSLQPTGGTLAEIQDIKNRWVQEFSQYDAGWSYVGPPLPWPLLDDRAAIPNRLGTYMLAGLPVISERLPGFYRHDVIADTGAAIEFDPKDYAALAAALREHEQLDALTTNARNSRERFSFESTLDELTGFLTGTIENRRERSPRRNPGAKGVSSEVIAFAVRPLSVRGMLAKSATPGTVRMRVENRLEDFWSRFRWFFARTIGRRALARELARPQRGS